MVSTRSLRCVLLLALVAGCSPRWDEPVPYAGGTVAGSLANGLGYVIVPEPRPAGFVELRLVVDAGRRQGRRDRINEAHLVEHLIFRTTAHDPAIAALEREGNAFGRDQTGSVHFDHTIYELRSRAAPESIDSALEVLAAWAGPLRFTDEDLEKELRIVADEYRIKQPLEQEDEPIAVLEALGRMDSALVNLGQMAEALASVTAADLHRFHGQRYRPGHMVVIVAGDVDAAEVAAAVDRRFASLRGSGGGPPSAATPAAGSSGRQRIRELGHRVGSGNLVTFENPAPLAMRHLRSRGEVRGALADRLVAAAIERRLEAARCIPWRFARDAEVFAAPWHGDTLPRALEELRRLEVHGLRSWEVEEDKDRLRSDLRAALERNRAESGALAEALVRQVVGIAIEPVDDRQLAAILGMISGLRRGELETQIRDWVANRVTVLATPRQDVGLDSLRVLDERVRTADVEPPAKRPPERAAAAAVEAREEGEIVRREPVAPLDAELWRLSNGALMIVKQTPEGNLRLIGHSPGGRSLLDRRDLPAAGPLASRFQKLVTVQGASEPIFFSTSVDYASERLDFSLPSSGPDVLLDRLAEVQDPDQSWFEESTTFLVSAAATLPAFAGLSAELRDRIHGDHPWRIPDLDELKTVDPEASMQIFRDRFANAADFVFVLTGPFESEPAEAVARRLAGWPSSDRREKPIDRARPFLAASASAASDSGAASAWEPRTLAVPSAGDGAAGMLFAGDAEWSLDGQLALEITFDALYFRLKDRLRDQLGSTYHVTGEAVFDAAPRERFGLVVVASCDPGGASQLADEMASVARDFLAGLAEGADGALESLREARTRAIFAAERGRSSSAYWARYLEMILVRGLAPEEVADVAARIREIPVERLRDAARAFLDESNVLVAVAIAPGTSG